jgi:uncharacterized membrane protein
MPYEWTTISPDTRKLRLWPYRSLSAKGFVLFIGGTATFISLPLLSVLGSPVLWGLLPFFVAAVGGMYLALQRSYRDAEITEELLLSPALAELQRHGPRGQHRHWAANPHWVRVELHLKGGPVPHYITLRGGPREVELGSFLSEEERVLLAPELRQALADLNQA